MADLLIHPGMASLTWTLVLMQVLSLIWMGMVVAEYGVMARKQSAFLRALNQAASTPRRWPVLVIAYIASTVAIATVSLGLYAFQPHLL